MVVQAMRNLRFKMGFMITVAHLIGFTSYKTSELVAIYDFVGSITQPNATAYLIANTVLKSSIYKYDDLTKYLAEQIIEKNNLKDKFIEECADVHSVSDVADLQNDKSNITKMLSYNTMNLNELCIESREKDIEEFIVKKSIVFAFLVCIMCYGNKAVHRALDLFKQILSMVMQFAPRRRARRLTIAPVVSNNESTRGRMQLRDRSHSSESVNQIQLAGAKKKAVKIKGKKKKT